MYVSKPSQPGRPPVLPTPSATDRKTRAMRPFDPQGSPRNWVVEKTPTTQQQVMGRYMVNCGADAVYRFYDANKALLYIGMTSGTPYMRWTDHRRTAAWWTLAAYVSIEWVLNGNAAVVEKAAIRAERPPYNKTHNTPRVRMELRLDGGPAAIIDQLRMTLLPEDFAALAAAFVATEHGERV